MAKRKNGEGSYGKKTIKGVQYNYYRDSNGKYTYAKTMKELRDKVKKKSEEPPAPKGDYSKKYFGEYCKAWLKQVAKRKITSRTYDDYESIIEHRIVPFDISDVMLESITVDMINKYIEQLNSKYSLGTVQKTWAIVNQVLKYGMEEDDIPKFNRSKIILPKERDVAVKKKDVKFINNYDMEELYKVSQGRTPQNKQWGNGSKLIIFIMYSGLRIGEATSLKWKHVNKEFDTIEVKEAIASIKERDKNGELIKNEDGTSNYKKIFKEPKSQSGVRIVPLPERATEILKYFYDNYSHNPEDPVFVTKKNTLFVFSDLRITLKTMLKYSNCECKDYTPHSLRHGYGSILITSGVPIATVSKLLGHSSIEITSRIYYHLLKDETAEQIKNVFNKKSTE